MPKSRFFRTPSNKVLQGYFFSVLGGLICAANLNTLIVPLKLFNGGFVGVSQMISDFLINVLHVGIPPTFNLSGVMLMLLNVPLMLLAFREISRTFFLKSALTVACQSLAMTMIPIPTTPLIEDRLTACIIGGLIAGSGIGLTLRSGGSGGGTDIIGVYCTKKFPDMSVGKLSISVSSVVFLYCLFRYDLQSVVYSIIFAATTVLVMDRFHYQNIKSSAMIITKHKEVADSIVQLLQRGVTCWQGYGAYTHESSYIFMTVLSKFEINRLKRIVHDIDPQAFIIVNDRLDISGNFVKRL